VSARELSQAISQVKGSLMLGLESMSNRMMRIARQEIYFGRYFTLDEIIESVEQVTAEQVRTVAQELFGTSNFSRVVLLPASQNS
jgi:predicted Zn-dependent peptidase